MRSGFLKIEGQHLKCADPVVDTGDTFDFARIIVSHKDTLKLWVKLLDRSHAEDHSQRELGLMNIPLKKEKIPEIKRRIRVQDEIIGWLQDEKDPDSLVQLGTYLLPLTDLS